MGYKLRVHRVGLRKNAMSSGMAASMLNARDKSVGLYFDSTLTLDVRSVALVILVLIEHYKTFAETSNTIRYV